MNIDQLMRELTLEEKASLLSGQDFWRTRSIPRMGIPSIMMTDGPHGLRKETGSGAGLSRNLPATCFPTAACLASSWDRYLVAEVGSAIAEEALEEKVSVVLGPGANIKRSPLCGRNFEYFSEDPYLSGEMARCWIEGAQQRGVGASLKHFAANNQETRRLTIDAVLDERALREIYLRGFELAVRGAQPWTVMAAYNRLNGDYCVEHPRLLNEILRQEWGFTGLVVSDWGAANERAAGLRAGLDLEMPGVPNGNAELIVKAVKAGELDEQALNYSVRRVLELVERAQKALEKDVHYDRDAHHALARRAAAEGAVLLKNENHLLPLNKDQKIALIGGFAKNPRYQGSGSSSMNPTRLDTLYGELVKLMGEERLSFAPGYELGDDHPHAGLIEEAVRAARNTGTAVICAGLPEMDEVEGLDRECLRLPDAHNALIEAVAKVCPRVVVVLSNGAPVEMPWESQVGAILEGYLGGQAGAGALADILLGLANPCGKLAESFPLWLEDNPSFHSFPGGPRTVEYRESIYVGYRYYDKAGKDVLFPLGHGLSYTRFEYSDLRLDNPMIQSGGNLKLSFTIKNAGDRKGKETAQVYVRDACCSVFRPDKELAGFAKIELDAGEMKTVEIELDARSFAFYSPAQGAWTAEPGEFEILVGASSRDIRLKAVMRLSGEEPRYEDAFSPDLAQYFSPPLDGDFNAQGFERLLGRPLPDNSPEAAGSFTLNTPMLDMRGTLVGRMLHAYTEREVKKLTAGFEDTPNALMMRKMVAEGPLRLMLMSAGGQINRGMLEGLLMMLNGKPLRGLFRLLKARKGLNR